MPQSNVYRAGYPVIARTESLGYLAGKYIRRNFWASAAAAMFVLLLSIFAATMAWQQAQTALQRTLAQSLQYLPRFGPFWPRCPLIGGLAPVLPSRLPPCWPNWWPGPEATPIGGLAPMLAK